MKIILIAESILTAWADLVRERADTDERMKPAVLLSKTLELLDVKEAELDILEPAAKSVTDTGESDGVNVLLDESIMKNWAAAIRKAGGTSELLMASELLEKTKDLIESDVEFDILATYIKEMLANAKLTATESKEAVVTAEISNTPEAKLTIGEPNDVKAEAGMVIKEFMAILKQEFDITSNGNEMAVDSDTHIDVGESNEASAIVVMGGNASTAKAVSQLPLSEAMVSIDIYSERCEAACQMPLPEAPVNAEFIITAKAEQGEAAEALVNTAVNLSTRVVATPQIPLPETGINISADTDAKILPAIGHEERVLMEIERDVTADVYAGELQEVRASPVAEFDPEVNLYAGEGKDVGTMTGYGLDTSATLYPAESTDGKAVAVSELSVDKAVLSGDGNKNILEHIALGLTAIARLTVQIKEDFEYPTLENGVLSITQAYRTTNNDGILEVI